jgi:hypothetical protein
MGETAVGSGRNIPTQIPRANGIQQDLDQQWRKGTELKINRHAVSFFCYLVYNILQQFKYGQGQRAIPCYDFCTCWGR